MASKTTAKAKTAGASTPSDRKAPAKKPGRVRNVRNLPDDVIVEWEGEDYTIPKDAIDDVEFVLALEGGKKMTALIVLMGDEQWRTWCAKNRDGSRVRVSDADAFLESLAEAMQKVVKSGN